MTDHDSEANKWDRDYDRERDELDNDPENTAVTRRQRARETLKENCQSDEDSD